MNIAPIVLFAYNRPEHLRRTLLSLQRNALARDSQLYAFVDGPKNPDDELLVSAVRRQLADLQGFASIKLQVRDYNLGLARSVIAGVSEVLAEHDRVIVLEDDLVSGHHFLTFMNRALDRYAGSPRIFSVSGYIYPYTLRAGYGPDVLLLPRCSTWGWGTWRNRWDKADWAMVDARERLDDPTYCESLQKGGKDLPAMLRQWLDGKIDSWGLPWSCTHAQHEAFALFPVRNHIINIGLDGSGVHCSVGCLGNGQLSAQSSYEMPENIAPDEDMIRRVTAFFG